MNEIKVVTIEDDSVSKKIEMTAKHLQNKYSKVRKINEKVLKKRSPIQRILSFVFDVFVALVVLLTAIICFSSINSKIQGTCPSFGGYSTMVVKSGSMRASGFEVGQSITVRTCDTKTLHEGDKIAFYVYERDYKSCDIDSLIKINNNSIEGESSYKFSWGSLVGIQSGHLIDAAKAGSTPVFHHIKSIFEDTNGTRWFKTYGSSNGSDDIWYISENMVIGLYDDSTVANVFSGIITAVNSQFGFLVLLVPVVLLGLIIVFEAYKNLQRAKLELDCVEQKRKITDPICVRNDIGFGMDTKTKYKILAQASDSEHSEYISLLWKKGFIPKNIMKYYMRRDVILGYNRKLCELNKQCEEMFKRGDKPTKIAKYYTEEKQKLMDEQRQMAKKLRQMRAEEQKREMENKSDSLGKTGADEVDSNTNKGEKQVLKVKKQDIEKSKNEKQSSKSISASKNTKTTKPTGAKKSQNRK